MPLPRENAMNKLSKEKRKRLLLVVIITLEFVGGIWCGVINFQKLSLKSLAERKITAMAKLDQMKKAIGSSEQLESQMEQARASLGKLEDSMASGDLLAWTIGAIRQFKLAYKIEIPQFSQIDGPKPTTLLADFPYQQATLTVAGTAYFQDLGRFIADFENQFPYARIQNLNVEPLMTAAAAEREKLSFKMDIVV